MYNSLVIALYQKTKSYNSHRALEVREKLMNSCFANFRNPFSQASSKLYSLHLPMYNMQVSKTSYIKKAEYRQLREQLIRIVINLIENWLYSISLAILKTVMIKMETSDEHTKSNYESTNHVFTNFSTNICNDFFFSSSNLRKKKPYWSKLFF